MMAIIEFFIGNVDWAEAAEICTLVDKRQASRRSHRFLRARQGWLCLAAIFFLGVVAATSAFTLSEADAQRIGKRIWQNECNGTVSGLTSWNEGENFASLGIGHFIWYPKGVRGPFEESFPKLVSFISRHGAKLPAMLLAPNPLSCPWPTRREFLAAENTRDMKQLRQFLVDTVDLQTQFMVARLEESLPKMLSAAPPAERAEIERRFNSLGATGQGCYALVDYVNFKGEGVLPTERYRGRGWGLLQVLEGIRDSSSASEFARSAERVLRQRVQNAPPQRNESRWLAGWLNRVHSYTKE